MEITSRFARFIPYRSAVNIFSKYLLGIIKKADQFQKSLPFLVNKSTAYR